MAPQIYLCALVLGTSRCRSVEQLVSILLYCVCHVSEVFSLSLYVKLSDDNSQIKLCSTFCIPSSALEVHSGTKQNTSLEVSKNLVW